MSTATVTSKGQITIPVEVRQRLGIDAGDRVEFVEIAEREFVIKPIVDDVRSLKGMLRPPKQPVSTQMMRDAVRRKAQRSQ
ncbi:MAG TPA: AbrB/MazE/SpoVT family DNA-binding domain-containing protein [Candidatus Obscuribacterales bacterium]